MAEKLEVDRGKLAEFCRRHEIVSLAFFGSVLRDDFGPSSDVDVLVEFAPHSTVGLIALAGLEIELSKIVGRRVDMRTPNDLSRYFRDRVIAEAVTQYAA